MSELFIKPKIANNILELIGGTPMVKVGKYAEKNGALSNILLKMEMYEPGFSIKDRIVLSIIEDAEQRGEIFPGKTTIVEATSGNVGVSLSIICAIKGYDCIIVMSQFSQLDIKILIHSYGAKLHLTPGMLGMQGAISYANTLMNKLGKSGFLLNQFINEMAIQTNYIKTGPEIWYQTDGKVDILVCGVGTGSTIMGVGKFLKEVNPDIKIIAVEPSESAVLSGNESNVHSITGIGVGFIPPNVDIHFFDEIFKVSESESIDAVIQLMQNDGITIGFSGGATLFAAKEMSKRNSNIGKNIVVIIPSSGERYLYTKLFSQKYIDTLNFEIENISL
jgi:cysteine synthase A